MDTLTFFITFILVIVGLEILLKLNKKSGNQLTISDRILAGGFYSVPLFEILKDNIHIFKDTGIPNSQIYMEFYYWYEKVPYLNYILFFGTYFVFIYYRLIPLKYFVRYNIMQGLLVFIAASLIVNIYYITLVDIASSNSTNELVQFVSSALKYGFSSLIFGIEALLLYCMIYSLLGKYSVIPFISDSLVWHVGDKEKN